MEVTLPYIDEMLGQLDINAPGFEETFSQDIHFGFWSNPTSSMPAKSLGEYKNAMEALTDEVLRLARATSSSRIIDIGCGFGGAINRMNHHLEKASLVGLNIDERQVEIAKCFCGTGIRENHISFTVADAQETRLASNSFDTALAIESILHMPHREQFLREMLRILKPGGSLVTTEIVLEPRKVLRRLLDVLFHISVIRQYMAKVGTLGRPGTMSLYRKLAGKVGFDIAAVEDWSPNVVPTFASLKVVKQDEANVPGSAYAPRLLDFAAMMFNRGAYRYLAIRFRKPGTGAFDRMEDLEA